MKCRVSDALQAGSRQVLASREHPIVPLFNSERACNQICYEIGVCVTVAMGQTYSCRDGAFGLRGRCTSGQFCQALDYNIDDVAKHTRREGQAGVESR